MSSKCAAYLSNGEQANLQYVGKVPGKAKFVNSSCFKHTTDTGNTGLKFKTNVSVLFYEISFTVLPTPSSGSVFYSFASGLYGYYGNTVRIFGATPSLAVPPPTIGKLMYIKIRRYENWFGVYHNNILVGTYTGTHNNITNMVLSHIGRGSTASGFSLGGNIWNFEITELDSSGNYIQTLGHWPLCEPIIDPSNHTYHDVSGNGNHATLINGTMANDGKQDEFHYLQRGLKNDGVNQIIPILDDESGFADGSLLTDENAIQQDSHSFLNTGTELEPYDYPALKQADKDNNQWYDGTTTKRKSFSSLTFGNFNNKYYTEVDAEKTTNRQIVTYNKSLISKQNNTEEIVRNVQLLQSGIGNWIIETNFTVI